MKKITIILSLIVTLLMAGRNSLCYSQTVVVHTNMALWAAEGANLGVDLAVNDFQTVGVTAMATLGESWVKKTDLSGMQLDYKFWLTRKLLQGFFLGPQFGLYHYRMDEDRSVLRHTALTAGIQGGYGWMLSRHWNLDVAYGAGYLLYADPRSHHKFVTTNFGVNISYVF